MRDPIVKFLNVSKSYPSYHHITGGLKSFLVNFPKAIQTLRKDRNDVLQEISFSVERGETLGIIGRNGSGKSTILGLIAGVLKPTEGVVEIRGRVSPLLELGAGFHPDLTGRENVELNGVLLGLSRKKAFSLQDSIIDFSEIRRVIDEPVRTYSSGQMARLAFSVAVHLDPQILLVDEILAVGDTSFQRKCFERLAEFRAAGVTIVLVSHDLSAVQRICDRVIWIEERGVRASGPPERVVRSYLAQELPENSIHGELSATRATFDLPESPERSTTDTDALSLK